jgi:hypothetical protein
VEEESWKAHLRLSLFHSEITNATPPPF